MYIYISDTLCSTNSRQQRGASHLLDKPFTTGGSLLLSATTQSLRGPRRPQANAYAQMEKLGASRPYRWHHHHGRLLATHNPIRNDHRSSRGSNSPCVTIEEYTSIYPSSQKNKKKSANRDKVCASARIPDPSKKRQVVFPCATWDKVRVLTIQPQTRSKTIPGWVTATTVSLTGDDLVYKKLYKKKKRKKKKKSSPQSSSSQPIQPKTKQTGTYEYHINKHERRVHIEQQQQKQKQKQCSLSHHTTYASPSSSEG